MSLKVDFCALESTPEEYPSGPTLEPHSSTPEQHSNTLEHDSNAAEQHPSNAEQHLFGYSGRCSNMVLLKYIFTLSSAHKPNIMKQSRPKLDTLPKYVLLHLFSYLTIQDLWSLSGCSPRLYNVASSEKKFWKNVHIACNGSSSCCIRLLSFLSDFTTTIHLYKSTEVSSSDLAEDSRDKCFEPNFLKILKSLPNLKSFTLENHSLKYRHMLNLRCLPKWLGLTELRLKRINLLGLNGRPCLAFLDLHLYLPNLEVVDLSHCSWVMSHIFWSLSKCRHLKKLIMVGCNEIDYIVPPLSETTVLRLITSTVFGFWELETLDLRHTYVTFEEIGFFKQLNNLKHILLEEPEDSSIKTTEQLERRRKIRNHYQRLDSYWWGAPEYDPEDLENIPRIFCLSEYASSWLETLVVRNNSEITDLTLLEIKEFFGSMKYLDVTGTKCTAQGIAKFQIRCPEVKVWHDSIVGNAELPIQGCN